MAITAGYLRPIVFIDASKKPIPTAYKNTSGSLIFKSIGDKNLNFTICTNMGQGIFITLDGSTDHFFIPPSAAPGAFSLYTFYNVVIRPAFRIRSAASGPISSGLVYITMWG